MPKRSLVIRAPQTTGEVGAATALVQQALLPDWQFGADALSQTLTDALVAVRGGELIGALALHSGPPATINVVATRSQDRRTGVGTALVEAACAALRQRGASAVNVGLRREALQPGVDLREALGAGARPVRRRGRGRYTGSHGGGGR